MLGSRWRSPGVRLASQSVALVILLASTWVIVGLALTDTGTGAVSAGRTVFASLGLLLLATVTRTDRSRPRARADDARPVAYTPTQLLVLAGTGVAGYTVLSTVAIDLAGPTLPSLVMALSPAVVLIAEAAIAAKPIRRGILVATCVAVAGAALYIAPRLEGVGTPRVGLGALAAIGAMASMAAYGLYFAHLNRGYDGPMTPRLVPIFAVGSIPLAMWAIVETVSGTAIALGSIAVLAVLGIVIYVPAYLVQHRVIVTAGPAFASLLALAVPPLVGVVSAMSGLAAPPDLLQAAGVGLTLAGMVAVIRLRMPRPHAGPSPARAGAHPGPGEDTTARRGSG